jgi:hypothetical protein
MLSSMRTQERFDDLQDYRNRESANTLAIGCEAGQVIAPLVFRTLDSLRRLDFSYYSTDDTETPCPDQEEAAVTPKSIWEPLYSRESQKRGSFC